jgi:hypothetical protein
MKANALDVCRNGHEAVRRKDGTCKQCAAAAARRWKDRNPEKHRANIKAYDAKRTNRYNDRAAIRMRAYYRKKAGIPEASYACPEHCECCGRKMGEGKQKHLDHDHVTGAFRGWLCNRCNLGIGMLGDCLEGVLKAVAYLKR